MMGTLANRNNTNNRAYGFDQRAERKLDAVPTHMAETLPDGDYPYNYSVTGNYPVK
jgi:hypothetical protein